MFSGSDALTQRLQPELQQKDPLVARESTPVLKRSWSGGCRVQEWSQKAGMAKELLDQTHDQANPHAAFDIV